MKWWIIVGGGGFLLIHALFFGLVYWRLGKLAKELTNKKSK